MSFQVPPEHVEIIRQILKLPVEKTDGFLAALDKADPQFNYADLAQQVFSPENMSWAMTDGITRILVSLYRTGDREEPLDEFLDGDVLQSLTEANVFTETARDEEWKRLRAFLSSALSHERAVGTAAKAGQVQTDHDRIFCSARILTDLRPIYHFKVLEKPDAATIVHMLKITHRDTHGNRSDIFFALDSNDLIAMDRIVDRAMEKEQTLRNVMKDSGVTILNAGLFY